MIDKIKNYLYIVFVTFVFFSFSKVVFAGTFSVSVNTTTVTVGNTVKFTLNVSNQAGKFSVSSSDTSVLSGGIEEFYDSTSTTIYFTAKKEGTAVITVKGVDVTNYDGSNGNATKTITVKVVNKQNSSGGSNSSNDNTIDINKNYSSDNFLKSLKIVDYDIDFDKEKLEYEIEVDEDVSEVEVIAKASDENAKVMGDGKVKLTDGLNSIKIIVIAENGNEKVYEIKITVKDKNPIIIKVDKKEYTLVKKVEQLTIPEGFKPMEALIDSKKIPALYNDKVGYILVGLKDDKGNVKLYVYDNKKNSYSLYNEIISGTTRLYVMRGKNIPSNLKEYQEKINDYDIYIYKNGKKSNFGLLYGMNINTGKLGWYRYDLEEYTLQRYETKDLERLSIINNKYLITITILSMSILMLMLFTLILISKIKRR